MISFQYFAWDEKKNMVLKHDGKVYRESPWAMMLAEEKYYLVCFDDEDGIKYYRVDKMTNIKILDEQRTGKDVFDKFDIASYAKKRFRMYDGKEVKVRLLCENGLANAIIDRFGKNIMLSRHDENHFEVNVEVAVSNQFYAWILALGSGVKIVGPDEVVDELKELLKKCNNLYF